VHRFPVPAASERIRRCFGDCFENGSDSRRDWTALEEVAPGHRTRDVVVRVPLEEVNAPRLGALLR
jgi:hypothetical protein